MINLFLFNKSIKKKILLRHFIISKCLCYTNVKLILLENETLEKPRIKRKLHRTLLIKTRDVL